MGDITTRTLSSSPLIVVTISYGTGIGIDEHFIAIIAQAALRGVRTVGTECVELPGLQPADKDVPVVKRAILLGIQQNRAGGFCIIGMSEKQQL
jgi:hypothetical protein